MLEEIIKERNRKLEKYKQFADPYPAAVKRSILIGSLLKKFNELIKNKKKITVVGRLFAWRDQGKIIFGDLKDESGKIQIILSEAETKNFKLFKETVDIGDFLEVEGLLFKTKRGEKSIKVSQIRIIAKSLRPLPSQWYGLTDVETRLRKRYLDILLDPLVKKIFEQKSVFWSEIRETLKKEGFLEVETPVFELLPGGADAEPFVTHHNALDEDFYLRISLELPLKKLLVGGYEKVFEIGRVFRNEGIDREHLQDYTQMECYAAYWDYDKMMAFVEKMYKKVIKKTIGSLKTTFGDKIIDWGKKWQKIDYFEIFEKETKIDLSKASYEQLIQKVISLDLNLKKEELLILGKGRLIDLIFKKVIRPKLIQPVFVIGHPIEISPLAKTEPNNTSKVRRFQILAAGTEVGNGWSELNDPLEQRRRFEEQMKLREKGDKEAKWLDEDYLEAMEYGMPPAAGFGMSERLFAILMDKPIRETVFFPLMRKEKNK